MELISREEAIQELEFICENKILSEEGTYALCIALDEMKSNSRPKGKFEYLGESKRATYVDMYKCSNCDFVSLSLGDDFLNYCPNCGADMRETETWQTSKGNVEMPKGLFDKIYEDGEE